MALGLSLSGLPSAMAQSVHIKGVPDYAWHLGCFGTATGNLFGFWDRNGLPDFYTGPTGGGVAPLNSRASQGNAGIRSLWASAAGLDGRPRDRPGHQDDYYVAYQSVVPDPFVTQGRDEHAPDCIGDFIGLNQNKWTDLGGECRGNIDAYAYVFWDSTGNRREADPDADSGIPAGADMPNGLISWSRHRGYEAESFCQLADFHPDVTAGHGFTFEDLQAEIDAGYPVLLFLQPFDVYSRTLRGVAGVNPDIHGMLAYGYLVDEDGSRYVRFRTSWASGDFEFAPWAAVPWTPNGELNYPLRGVIGYRPLPKIRSFGHEGDTLVLRWDGPSAVLVNDTSGEETPAHRYVVERATSLTAGDWAPVSEIQSEREFRVTGSGFDPEFFRVSLVP
ncbi:MAG: hypothetical protein KF791_01335 [Verrucomicrobiae bacterium]|nr:hypothetical protein [Verrucomicrobiae bacterium]